MQTTKKSTATVAGITGAIIGAGVTAAAVALSDKDTRKKVTNKLMDVKKQAEHAISDVRKKADDAGTEAGKMIESQKKTVEDVTTKTDTPSAL